MTIFGPRMKITRMEWANSRLSTLTRSPFIKIKILSSFSFQRTTHYIRVDIGICDT
jgi:hypothetical protein